jgi:predicted AlkP superfamily pyrophosphatase or phosphodiesterase
MGSRFVRFASAVLLLPLLGRAVRAEEPQVAPPPRLVVLVVVDQLRADFLDRFGARLRTYGANDGFRRLAREGAHFTDCRLDHAGTFTGPGHATIATGAQPSAHGIVGNVWLERGVERPVYCARDDEATIFGAPGAAAAEKVGVANLRGETLGDAMKAGLTPRPVVVGVSLKDRSALFLAGRRADAAFWVDLQAGGFVTSDRGRVFLDGPDAATTRKGVESRLLGFNAGRLPTFEATWERDPRAAAGYPEAEGDDRPAERLPNGSGAAFPHRSSLPDAAVDLRHIEGSPAGNDLLVAFVDEVLTLGEARPGTTRGADETRLALGAVEGRTDLLAVSFSTQDLVGHRYGPESEEAADAFVRLDASLGRLLSLLDAKVGTGRWIVALTADHGGVWIPEAATAAGLDAGRVTDAALVGAVDGAFGAPSGLRVVEGNAYLPPLAEGNGVPDPGEARRREDRAREAMLRVPGVWRVCTRSQLLDGTVPPDGPGRGALHSFDALRSGDLVFQLRPGWIFERAPTPADPRSAPKSTHGSPWTYDRRVPLLLAGPGIVPGVYAAPVSVVDLVATLATRLHVTPPSGCEGRALTEALDPTWLRRSTPLR